MYIIDSDMKLLNPAIEMGFHGISFINIPAVLHSIEHIIISNID